MSPNQTMLADVIRQYQGLPVVLDTPQAVVFLGTLKSVTEWGFWLENADIHDCRDGHADKEEYVFEAKTVGIRTNRRRIFVTRESVISISALDEVVQEDLGPPQPETSP